MERSFSESDWKVFRQLRELALERFCQRVLEDIGQVVLDSKKSSHERYLAVFKLIQERDARLANAFNDPKRSAALVQLVVIMKEGLLTEEEFSRFSEECRTSVQLILDLRRE
jgi:hypothetical protein